MAEYGIGTRFKQPVNLRELGITEDSVDEGHLLQEVNLSRTAFNSTDPSPALILVLSYLHQMHTDTQTLRDLC